MLLRFLNFSYIFFHFSVWPTGRTPWGEEFLRKKTVKNTAFGGSGGIRTLVPDHSDNRISSAAHYDRFDTLPTRTLYNTNWLFSIDY